jgi:hypothetical protein
MDFEFGDRVRVVKSPRYIHPSIARHISGLEGTISSGDPALHDYVVHIPGSPRPGGMYALSDEDLEYA